MNICRHTDLFHVCAYMYIHIRVRGQQLKDIIHKSSTSASTSIRLWQNIISSGGTAIPSLEKRRITNIFSTSATLLQYLLTHRLHRTVTQHCSYINNIEKKKKKKIKTGNVHFFVLPPCNDKIQTKTSSWLYVAVTKSHANVNYQSEDIFVSSRVAVPTSPRTTENTSSN